MRDPWTRILVGFATLPIVMMAGTGELLGQQAADFDVDRLYLTDEDTYLPFVVEETLPLSRALEQGRLDGETSVLVMDHPEAGRLALVADQMAYHHVAQGELAGEPWMVSF
jgi:hypothetical protein